jgi:ketosteroid isomerase-like protein
MSVRLRPYWFALALVTVALLPAPAVSADAPPAASTAELLAMDARWNRLRLAGDADALEPLLVDDWLLTHSDGRVQDKAAYLAELRTRTRRNTRIDNLDAVLRRYGDTLVVTGTSIQEAISNGQPWQGRFRFTRVWRWQDGAWRMLASHSSRIAEAP